MLSGSLNKNKSDHSFLYSVGNQRVNMEYYIQGIKKSLNTPNLSLSFENYKGSQTSTRFRVSYRQSQLKDYIILNHIGRRQYEIIMFYIISDQPQCLVHV